MAKASVKMGNKEQAIAYLEDAQVIGWYYNPIGLFDEIRCHQRTNYKVGSSVVPTVVVVSISETV